MKPGSKPISSPGRPEKYPPPLMRFLRSNISSKSRGRSRSSPMFMRKKNNNNTAIETQEPSSPKVTCMGQVRVRRSSGKTRRKKPPEVQTRRHRCRWINKAAIFCHCFHRKIKPNSCISVLRRWVSFFRIGFWRKSKGMKDSPRKSENFERENQEQDEEEEEKVQIFMSPSISSPPKNAFLLTRCRSAPYRSTSLASRFWGEEEENHEEEQTSKLNNGGLIIENPISQRVSVSVSDQESRRGSEFEGEEDEDFLKKVEDSIRERIIKSANIELVKSMEEEEGIGASSRPLILTRCKSEPARTAEKLNPEIGFWKKKRLGIPDSCLSNNL